MVVGGSKSKKHPIFPTARADLERKKEELNKYNRKFEWKQSPIPTKHQASSLSSTHSIRMIRSSLESRLKSSRETTITITDTSQFKLSSHQQQTKCHDRCSSPLSIMRTRSMCLHSQPNQPQSPPLQNKFLRKGSAVDRTIIRNILFSKINPDTCRSTQSYGNVPQNAAILQVMTEQIPLGLKDVVGGEEMLRMSHIVMGIDLKTASLRKRVMTAL